jgi:hypothetical protein
VTGVINASSNLLISGVPVVSRTSNAAHFASNTFVGFSNYITRMTTTGINLGSSGISTACTIVMSGSIYSSSSVTSPYLNASAPLYTPVIDWTPSLTLYSSNANLTGLSGLPSFNMGCPV